VRLWDTQEQKSVGRLEGNSGWVVGLNSVAFSPDGKIIASINDKEIYLFDIQEQKQIGILKGHTMTISSIAFTPDGKILVSSGNQDQTVRLWDVAKQKELAVLSNNSWVHTVVISPDGETIAAAVGSEALIRLWDTKTRKEIGVLNDPVTAAFSVAFSPDGKTLASCNQIGIIRIWNYKERKLIDEFQGPKTQGSPSVVVIIFSPDGKWLVSLYAGNAQFWDIQEQKEIATTQEQFHKANAVAFSPGGKWMATAGWDGIIQLWQVNISVQGKAVNPMGKATGTWGEVKKAQLFQNYPNPFNPETWIPFSLSKPEHVRIKIYNSTGLLVKTLDLGSKEPGLYTNREKAAYWDGKNEAGDTVASDVYYCVMQAGEYTSSRKMVMVR
jgi:WD40 repeat protein